MNAKDSMMEAGASERLPTAKKVAFALGQVGWSLAGYGAANFLNYFYLPPEEGGVALFPRMIHQATWPSSSCSSPSSASTSGVTRLPSPATMASYRPSVRW